MRGILIKNTKIAYRKKYKDYLLTLIGRCVKVFLYKCNEKEQ